MTRRERLLALENEQEDRLAKGYAKDATAEDLAWRADVDRRETSRVIDAHDLNEPKPDEPAEEEER